MLLPTLEMQMLGEFRLTFDDKLVTAVNSPRLQSLLAFLVLHRDAPQSRQHLAFMFWPDSSETQARANLPGSSLQDKSLVEVEQQGRQTRNYMLETVRHYAADKAAEIMEDADPEVRREMFLSSLESIRAQH